MRRRVLLTLGLLALLFTGGVAVLWLTGPGHRISKEGWAGIKQGMSRANVETVIGTPAGDYRKQQTTTRSLKTTRDYWGTAGAHQLEWLADDGIIRVQFDANDTAIGAAYFPDPANQISFASKLRRWLGLPWW